MSAGPAAKDGWRSRVHPFFVRIAEFNRKISLLVKRGSAQDLAEIDRLNREELPLINEDADRLYDEMKPNGGIRHLISLKIFGVDHLPPGAEISQGYFMYHWLCWFRFGVTAEELVRSYESGDLEAAKRINKLNLEYDRWRFGDLDPNKLRFKTDLDHFDLMTSGLDLGIEDLNAEELADCFDELCPCGNPHFPENLRKLKQRLLKEFPPITLDDSSNSR